MAANRYQISLGGGDKNIRELDGGDGRTALAQNH